MACHMMRQAINGTHIDLLAIRLKTESYETKFASKYMHKNIIFHENVFEKSQ